MQTRSNIENKASVRYWQKTAVSLKKRRKRAPHISFTIPYSNQFLSLKIIGYHKFQTPYSNQFLSVLHENKAVYNFHKKGAGFENRMLFLSRLGPGQYQKSSSEILSMFKTWYDLKTWLVQFTGQKKHLNITLSKSYIKFTFQKMPPLNNLQYQHCPNI